MQPRELRSLGVRALGNPIADFVRFRCCSSGSLKALLSRDRLRIIAGRPPAGLLSLSAQEAPRRIRTRGCSWYHLISQLTLPLYAAPTSDSSVTGLPGDFYSLQSADRAGFKISAPKLLPHLRLRTGLAAGEAFAVLSENALPEPVSLSVGRSVLLFFHAFVYEYASTLPQAAAFVKRNFPSRHRPPASTA